MVDIIAVNYPPPQSEMTPRPESGITEAIVHHGDDEPTETPLEIDAQHRAQTWAMIGYDYIVTSDGKIYKGRPDDVVPSAAYGENPQSVDVVLTGDFEPNTPGFEKAVPLAQLQSLKDLLVYLHEKYPTIQRTIGHRDVATDFPQDPGDYSTACPGDVLYDLLPEIRAYVAEKVAKP